MTIPHSKTARGVRTVEQHGAKYQIECIRTTGVRDSSLTEQARVQDALTKRSRIPSGGAYESSLSFGNYRGTPIAILDEIVIKRISGQLAPGKSFRVGLRDVFPPIAELSTADTTTGAPSVGRVQVPIVLDFAAVMPAPIVNVAPAPAPVVNVTNTPPPLPPPPPPFKEVKIIRDDDGDMTGALIS